MHHPNSYYELNNARLADLRRQVERNRLARARRARRENGTDLAGGAAGVSVRLLIIPGARGA